MPTGTGWWISPKGKVYEIDEHFFFVQERPELFGFAGKDAEKWKSSDRDAVLRKVIARGWIRVRNLTYETWELTPDAKRRIARHLKATKAWAIDPLRVSEVKFGRWTHLRAGDVRPGRKLSHICPGAVVGGEERRLL